jgi:hypothetical protein
LLKDDPSTDISKEIYQNISKSRLFKAASKPLILPCPNVIEWLIRRTDHKRITIHNFEGKHVASFQPSMLHHMYHFKEPQIKATQEWLQKKAEAVDYLAHMKGWWDIGNFRYKP